MTVSTLMADWPGRDPESLLWLASYPRSGNTLTRILLANYFAAGDEPYDINRLHDFIPADTGPLLWERAGIELSASDSSETIWKARPSIIAHHRKTKTPGILSGLKTHNANVHIFGVSGFDFRPNDRILYIVRHPLDVLLSSADYNAKEIDAAIDMMISPGFTVRGHEIGGLDARGSWVEHVTSWTTAAPCPILLLRYEELTTATESILRAILTFLGAPIIEERIRLAVASSRFDKLREQEATRSFVERPDFTSSGRFFREGKSLQWLRKLTPEQAYRLADACEKVMGVLGYTHPRNVLFDGRNALAPPQTSRQNLKPDSTRSL